MTIRDSALHGDAPTPASVVTPLVSGSMNWLAIQIAFQAGRNATEIKNLRELSDEDIGNYFRVRRAGMID